MKKLIFINIVITIFYNAIAIASPIQIENLLKDFEENAFDARKKYASTISIEGYIKNITSDDDNYYLALGTDSLFSFETLSVYGLDENILINLNKDDKITVKGKLGYTELLGIQFKEAKIVSKYKKNKYLKKTSTKKNPFNVTDIVKEHENNPIRSKVLFSGKIFVFGKSGSMSVDEDLFSEKKYYLLDLEDNNDEENIVQIDLGSKELSESIGQGLPLIFSGVLDNTKLLETKLESKIKKIKVDTVNSSVTKPLKIDEILKQYGKNPSNAEKMYSGIVYISGKVGSVDESSKYDDDFNEIKFSYLSLSGDGFMVSANIYFEDTNIYDKLTKDTNLIISGVIEEFTAYGFNVINAKLESGKLGSGVSKISSSINKPLNLKDIVNLYESNSKQARIKYSGELFIKGYINSISEDGFSMKGTDSIMDLDLLYINIRDEKILINLDSMEEHIVSGKIGEGEFLGLNLIDAKIVSKIKLKNMDRIITTSKKPINAEKLVDMFEHNPIRTRKILDGVIFTTGFSDGVHEHTLSDSTSFFLKFKGTTDTFDLDYLYVSFLNKNQYSKIKIGQKLLLKGKLGDVEFLGVSLNESALIK